MIRLGVAARVLGRPMPIMGGPHLSVALLGLREIFSYLAGIGAGAFRLPDTLLPRDLAAARVELAESADMLAELGAQARQARLRLSVHPGLHVALATDDDELAARASATLTLHAELLDALGCNRDGVIVVHVGAAGGAGQAALERFAVRYERLPRYVRERVAVEADQSCFDLATLVWLRRWSGVPLIFDSLHFQLHNPTCMPISEALSLALSSWPAGVRPKIHVSTQRTEAHLQPGRRGGAPVVLAPRRGQHADYLNPFEFVALLRAAAGLGDFDVMIEAKAADLALLRLRDDLHLYAPDLAEQVLDA